MISKRMLGVAVGAIAAMGIAAGPASAAGIGGGPSFTGVNNGSHAGGSTNHGNHTFRVGSAIAVTCTDADSSGSVNASPTDAHGHPTTATFDIAYSGCTATIFGFPAAAATVTDGGAWTLSTTSYNTSNGSGVAAITTNSTTTISVPSLGCTVSVPNQTVSVTTQNRNNETNTAGTANGVLINVNDSTISGTSSGCFGVPASFTNAQYTGVEHVSGVWGVD